MKKSFVFAAALAMSAVMSMSCLAEGEKVTATGVGQGIDGDVVVEVEADETTIYSITVVEQNETPGIGSVACETLPGAMVDANSILVDGVAGATVTATVVKNDKAKKVIVYKYKSKTGYHKKNGHRQQYTQVKIEKING